MSKLSTMLIVTACAGCANASQVPVARFANTPPVLVVNDRRDVPRPPEKRRFNRKVYHYDGVFQRRLTRALELPRPQRALGVNALDEVPDSTWFTNRIGLREMSIDELRTGPATRNSPELHKPWTVRATKAGGTVPGFVITDARGIEFVLKFDAPGLPEMGTAAGVIVNKLLWACGYNVPEDFVVFFDPSELELASNAVIDNPLGDEPLHRGELARRLSEIERMPDGRIRAIASRWIAGVTLGGHPGEGVRPDDRNDRIPHELRRDLRGAFSIFAWLDHTDVKEANFVDAWIEDRLDRRRHYVMHYLVDFDQALGVMALTDPDPRRGHESRVDFMAMTWSLLSLGLPRRSWEQRTSPGLRGVGLFEVASYDPGAWKPDFPSYLPFLTADDHDKFWGAKILMRFDRSQLQAIVETARLSDPRAAASIVETLIARQRETARHWFSRVSPLDRWAIDRAHDGDLALCFDDLLISHQLVRGAATATTYTVARYDRAGRPLGVHYQLGANPRGRTCAPLALAPGSDQYTIVRIDTARPGFAKSIFVHVANAPGATRPRVIGVWRP